MNRKILIIVSSFLLLIIGLIIYSCTDKEIETEPTRVATTRAEGDTFQSKYYNIIPGTEEWYSMENIEDRWNNSQIPNEILEVLSTEELVEACVQFPLSIYYSFYEDERGFITDAYKRFNGLKELANRRDAVEYLIQAYRQMNYGEPPVEQAYYNLSFGLSIAYWELVISDSSCMDKMTEEENEALLNVAREKLEMKMANTDYFGLLDVKRSLMLCAELMLRSGISFEKDELLLLENYKDNYFFYKPEMVEYIYNLLIR